MGLQKELELRDVGGRAVDQLDDLPEGAYLSVNVSPDTIFDGGLVQAVAPAAGRCMLELTEHVRVVHCERLDEAVGDLRRQGVGIG